MHIDKIIQMDWKALIIRWNLKCLKFLTIVRINFCFCKFLNKLIIFSVHCDDAPSITSVSDDQIKEIGQEAEFNCTAYPGVYSVLWNKNQVPLSNNGDTIIKGPKYESSYNKEQSIYSLKVRISFEYFSNYSKYFLIIM